MVDVDRNGGAVGSPPESHGSGDTDTETGIHISSSHGKRQSRLRFVAEIPTPAAGGLTGVEIVDGRRLLDIWTRESIRANSDT